MLRSHHHLGEQSYLKSIWDQAFIEVLIKGDTGFYLVTITYIAILAQVLTHLGTELFLSFAPLLFEFNGKIHQNLLIEGDPYTLE